MLTVLRSTWPLLLGVLLLMLGNGIQGTLLGIRGRIEGFSTLEMSYIMSAYFIGFLFGSRATPEMIRRVGHVRVFSALGSLISAVLVLYPVAPDPWAWIVLRIIIGFCFSGIYITTESWINNTSTNRTRGQALSLYMIVQMIGIIAAQGLLNTADPAEFTLFAVPSVLVSLAFLPILLSVAPAPSFELTDPLSLARLYRASPLGCVGMFLLGGVFAAQFGMASVWGTEVGLSVRNISIFVASIYLGGLVLQYPIGMASDRFGRRPLILALAVLGAAVSLVPLISSKLWVLCAVGAIIGGVSNPLYSLLLAYTNDYLENREMAAASAGLIFINGVGAIGGPILTGWAMAQVGPNGYFLFIAVLFALLAGYAGWRMTRRRVRGALHPSAFAVLSPNASAIAVEGAMESRDKG
jgi:MFS family permease